MNPVSRRELQERFRTLRSPILLGVWVLAAGVLTYLAYLYARGSVQDRFEGIGLSGLGSILASGSMGRFIMQATFLGLLTAVVFLVPGQAAVTIIGERERRTLQLLQVSQLSALSIVIGKLVSSLAYVLLLLLATTPLLVVPMLLGGVTIWQVASGIGMIIATAVMIGAVSTWISARSKSVQGAVLGSYVWAALLVFGTIALRFGEILLVSGGDYTTRYEGGVPRDEGREIVTSWMNPYVGLVDATSTPLTFEAEMVTAPYQPVRQVLLKRQGYAFSVSGDLYDPFPDYYDGYYGDVAFPGSGISADPFLSVGRAREADPIRAAVWWRTLLFEAVVTALALAGAARLVHVPRGRIRRRPSNGEARAPA